MGTRAPGACGGHAGRSRLRGEPEEFPTEEAQENERLRLFKLISELVQ